MESTLAILLIIAALALGLVVGWLAQARQASKAVAHHSIGAWPWRSPTLRLRSI